MAIKYQVRHMIPGRIRLQVPLLKNNMLLAHSCAQFLEAEECVTKVRINAWAASVMIEYDPGKGEILNKLRNAMEVVTPILSLPAPVLRGTPKNTVTTQAKKPQPAVRQNRGAGSLALRPLALTTATLGLSLFGGPLGMLLTLPLLGYNAYPILKRACNVLRYEHRLNVDFLDSLAIIISTVRGGLFTSAFMTWLINLGDFIRDRTAAKSRRAITELLDYQRRKAWVLRGKRKVEVRAEEIKPGDTVIVYSGGMIPVDGRVSKGIATVDQKTITGESLPVERRAGDQVYAATVTRDGKLYVRAERVAGETMAAQIVRLVEKAPVGETRIQNYAEKVADRLVAPSLAAATGLYAVSQDLNRLLSMIIIDYGTGIRVAAPTSILASMTHAARQGILVKGGRQFEKLNKVDTIVFDKTGTLTQGQPRVLNVSSYEERHFTPQRILALAAAAEARLRHPVAKAILTRAHEMNLRVPARSDSHYYIGLGVEVQVNGHTVHVGSERFMRKKNISIHCSNHDLRWLDGKGYSSLLLAVNGELKGLLSYADQIRVESSAVIKTLHNRAMRNLIMVTGDNAAVAKRVSAQLGLDRFFPEVLPDEKVEIVKQLQSEGRLVAMIGDGINDSPALAHADVGIAMKNGAEVARETADVVLMEENLWKLITAMDISKEAMGLIWQNTAIIAGLNTLAYALAIPRGLVSPSVTTLISNGSAILASLNAIRPILQY